MVLFDEEDFEEYENALNNHPQPPSAAPTFTDKKTFDRKILDITSPQGSCEVKKEIILDVDEEKMFDEYEQAYEELQNELMERRQKLCDDIKQNFGDNIEDEDE